MGKISLNTCGGFACSVAWCLDAEGNALVPPSSLPVHQIKYTLPKFPPTKPSMSQCHLRCFSATKRLDVIQSIGMSSAADLDKLAKWIEESRLDPNDPSNADLMYLMRVSDLPS